MRFIKRCIMANFHYRLLIVDDEPLSRELVQRALSEHGFEVCIAKDGFAALALMRGALPDLIVSDLKMPNMSGFEFLSIAQAIPSNPNHCRKRRIPPSCGTARRARRCLPCQTVQVRRTAGKDWGVTA